MNKDIGVLIPDRLKHMEVINTIASPVMRGIGILIMGEHLKNQQDGIPTIRIYLLQKDEKQFIVETELEALAFTDIESAMDFVMRLPELSALELMLMKGGWDIQRESGALHH